MGSIVHLFGEVSFLAVLDHLLLRRGPWVLVGARWAHKLLLLVRAVLCVEGMAVFADLEEWVRAVTLVSSWHHLASVVQHDVSCLQIVEHLLWLMMLLLSMGHSRLMVLLLLSW